MAPPKARSGSSSSNRRKRPRMIAPMASSKGDLSQPQFEELEIESNPADVAVQTKSTSNSARLSQTNPAKTPSSNPSSISHPQASGSSSNPSSTIQKGKARETSPEYGMTDPRLLDDLITRLTSSIAATFTDALDALRADLLVSRDEVKSLSETLKRQSDEVIALRNELHEVKSQYSASVISRAQQSTASSASSLRSDVSGATRLTWAEATARHRPASPIQQNPEVRQVLDSLVNPALPQQSQPPVPPPTNVDFYRNFTQIERDLKVAIIYVAGIKSLTYREIKSKL
ncbi:hypothetical protein HDU79_010296, partial [Rhizoclosmatium sp. JEL0117]